MDTVNSFDGTPIAYERSGTGPLVLVVGGALAEAATFAGLARRCAAFATVVRFDRRGRGQSGDRDPHRVVDEVADLRALCEVTGPPALCYGHSSGGLLALKAVAAGLPVGRVVCYEPPFLSGERSARIPGDLVGRLAGLAAGGRREEAVAAFLGLGTGMAPGEVAALRARPSWNAMAALAHTLAYDVALCAGEEAVSPADLEAVEAPTLVVAGGASRGTIREAAEDLAGHLPNGRLELLDGERHVVASAAIAPLLEAELRRAAGGS